MSLLRSLFEPKLVSVEARSYKSTVGTALDTGTQFSLHISTDINEPHATPEHIPYGASSARVVFHRVVRHPARAGFLWVSDCEACQAAVGFPE
jgi:hypothetical protein